VSPGKEMPQNSGLAEGVAIAGVPANKSPLVAIAANVRTIGFLFIYFLQINSNCYVHL
jgi:hypothetical protein